METPEQISVLRALRRIQKSIIKSEDKDFIVRSMQQAIQISNLVTPCVNELMNNREYKMNAKARAIALLIGDIDCIECNSYQDWETIHFQTASSIAMLMAVYVDGGITRELQLCE